MNARKMTTEARLDRMEALLVAALEAQGVAVPLSVVGEAPVAAPVRAAKKAAKKAPAKAPKAAVKAAPVGKVLPGHWALAKKGHQERVPNKGAVVGAVHVGVRTDKEGAKAHRWVVAEGPRGLFYHFAK